MCYNVITIKTERKIFLIPKHYYLIVDTEACQSEDKKSSFVYDLGVAIIDRKGIIYEKYGLIIADIFTDRSDLMTSNYYKQKRKKIINLYNQNKRLYVTFDTAKKIVNHLINKYNVTAIVGHYSRFDIHALENTNYLITKDKNNFFFPQNVSIWCTCTMARQIYLKRHLHKKNRNHLHDIHIQDHNFYNPQKSFLKGLALLEYQFL